MRTTTRQRWALAVTSAASFMVALDALVVSTALTQIQARSRRFARRARVDS